MSRASRIAVVGVGLVGASLARALRRVRPHTEIVGYDPAPDPQHVAAGVRWVLSAEEALAGADVGILAAPVPAILELLPLAARVCREGTLVTDTGSTKGEICTRASELFQSPTGPHFIGGHPMAGTEAQGAAASDPDLLRGAPYALCDPGQAPAGVRRSLEVLVRACGARPVWIEPEEHDRIVARVSHLPQMAVVALAALLEEEASRDPRLADLAGSGLRDLLRLASSPYPMWREIARSNGPELRRSLGALAGGLQEMAEKVGEGDLEEWFEAARRFREQRLRG